MSSLTIELPSQEAQTAFNLKRWEEVVADSSLNCIEGRVETDRYGHIVMSPPPAAKHGAFQFEIGRLLSSMLQNGRVYTECPISTADGVRAADVAWASSERLQKLGDKVCFPLAPEICVEVVSISNTDVEMQEKMLLYFDAGAREVWFCGPEGAMKFFGEEAVPLEASVLCPDFPQRVEV